MLNKSMSRKAVAAAIAGNVLEWYDFGIYGFLAGIIGKNFFPSSNDTSSLLMSFAVFGVGFLFRPLGAIVLGRIGDVKGRKVALLITVFMMAIGTTMIGFIPTYASIGIAAPLLIVLARLLQGFSAGGEWGGATTFIVEWAPDKGRGFYGSFQQSSTVAGLLLGSGVAALTSSIFTPDQMTDWAWRLPFLFGAILGPVGLYMRRNIDETPAYVEAQKAAQLAAESDQPVTAPLAVPGEDSPWVTCGRAFGFTMLWTSAFYIFLNYLPTFNQKYVSLTQSQALWSSTIGLVVLVLLIPVFGHLSDKIGRKPLLLACCAAMTILPWPLLSYMVSGAPFAAVIAIQILFGICLSMFSGAGPAAISEIFPTRSRSFLLSVSYSLSTTIFGGFAPFIATWMIAKTQNPVSPVFYVAACGVISFIVIWRLRETAFDKLK